jgi:hypothetical protein
VFNAGCGVINGSKLKNKNDQRLLKITEATGQRLLSITEVK